MADFQKHNSVASLRAGLDDGDVSVRDVVDQYRQTIDEQNDELNAFLGLYEAVDEQVAHAQQIIDDGRATSLTGIPVAVKDNILIKGETVSAGSKMLESYTATYTATAVQRLLDVGAVLVGRTNMDEFAMGSSTENSAFGPTRNPRDTSRVPGGSSGGSAAAVAAGMVPAALGSDTGGSIRQPAAFCGCVGLKPTYGAVSRYGLIAMGSSFDQIGPITSSVTDAELLFDAMHGPDPFDSTTIPGESLTQHVPKKPVVGVPRHLLEKEGLSEAVATHYTAVIEKVEAAGYETQDITLPDLDDVLAAYYVLIPAEVSSNLARFDGVRYGYHAEGEDLLDGYLKTRAGGFGAEVKRRIMLGTYMLSAGYHDAYYKNAQRVRSQIRSQMNDLFGEVDVLITPTAPQPAFQIGEKSDDPMAMYLQDIFTVIANIAGMPALSVPTGEVDGLPLGTQLMAAHGHERTLFRIGRELEKE